MSGGPFDIRALSASFEAWGDRVALEGESMLASVAAEQADEMRTIVRTSITKTGQAREAAGEGVPGRIESGDMHDEIDSSVERDGDEIIARWGWIHGAKDYYLMQDGGTKFIAEMDALHSTFEQGVEQVRAGLRELGGGL